MSGRRALFALSAANLYLSPAWIIAFGAGTAFDAKFLKNAYHRVYDFNHVDYLAGIPLLAAVGTAIYVLVSLPRGRGAVRFAVAAGAFLTLFDGIRRTSLHGLSLGNLSELAAAHPAAAVTLAVGLAGVLWAGRRQAAPLAERMIFICAPLIAIFLANVLYAAYLVHPPGENWLAIDRGLAPRQPVDPTRTRTVAILFDAWDYDATFEAHPLAVPMPNVRRLRAQSVYTTDARMFGGDTLRAVPSFTTGTYVRESIPDKGSDLRLAFRDKPDTRRWSEMTTLFHLAHDSGLNAAVAVETYHQYCFLFRRVLSDCYPPLSPLVHQTTLLTSMRKVLLKALPVVGARINAAYFDPLAPAGYVERFQTLRTAFLERVADPSLGFVYVHVFLPHPPYYYDPDTGAFTEPNDDDRNYFKQLVLLDRTVGEVRAAMEATGTWDNTNVLLFADHPGPGGIPLPVTVTRTKRIPIILKLAGQRSAVAVHDELPAQRLYDVLKAIFERRLDSPEDAVRLLAATPAKP